ncbi:MAG: hypothetical protein PHQ01_03940, partial [Candidatus Pacebacteria bacterium]|nr:hypothetical protein [Candidatus Paceibacterota bacterium]
MNFETNFNETNETEKWKNQFISEQKLVDLEELIKAEEEKNEKIDDFSHKGNDRYYELVDEYNKIKEEIGESQPLTREQKLIALDKLINERMEEIDKEGINLHYDGDEVYYGLVDKYNKLMGEVSVEESNEIPVPQPVVEEVKSEEEFNEGVEEESQEIPVPQPVIEAFKPEERSAILKKSISALLEKLIDEKLEEMERDDNRTIDPELSAWIDEYNELTQTKEEIKPDRSAILKKLIDEKLEEMERDDNRTIDPELSAWIDEYNELTEKEESGEGTLVISPEEIKMGEEVKSKLGEMQKEANAETAELSPEKGSLFNRLKESFKNSENQKKALIFATALAVGTAVPYASMVYFGGGFFGIGAGASIPILKMIGIASKSAYLGGPLGGALIGLATKKMLDLGFAKAENNEREMNEDEMEILIKNVEKTMKQVNIEDLDKNS